MKFAAGILMKAHGAGNRKLPWQYSVVLFEADELPEAERKAYEYGRECETQYRARTEQMSVGNSSLFTRSNP
jgi:hypothetical protein